MIHPTPLLAETLAALTRDLCAIPSVTGDEALLAEHVVNWLATTPFQVERVGNALAARLPSRGLPLVTLVGHLDTVPPQPGTGPLRLEGERIHGLGASDMKSGLALMLHLARTLDPAALGYDLALVFYDGEEGPFENNGLEPLLDVATWLDDTRLAIILEPSQNEPQLGCMGTLQARVIFEGRGAHSARPWQGENAIYKALPVLHALADWPPRPVEVEGLIFRETMVATLAKGGRAPNMVPDHFEINVNHRFAPGCSQDEAIQRVRQLVGGHAQVQVLDIAPAATVDRHQPLVRTFLDHVGTPPAPKQAWTDIARFSARGVPAVNWGPGVNAQAHQADEYAEAPLLAVGFEALWAFLHAGPGAA